MKLKTEDILKPGITLLEAHKIDWNDPEVKKAFAETRKEQKRIKKLMNRPFKNLVITI